MRIKSSIKEYKVTFIDGFNQSLDSVYNSGDVIFYDNNLKISLPDSMVSVGLDISEHTKSFANIPVIIDSLPAGFNKQNKLIAVGGGITQDIVSFVASILFRGIDWIFYPTSLLAQGDSCIGGKTSINYKNSKNQLGGFYPPNEIYIDTKFLETLSNNDITSGMGEMLHFYLVAGEYDYKFYLDNISDMKVLVKRCLEIKKHFIEIDEFDKGERLKLNYGHTFGHAIEGATQYKIPHGIAVSLGMDLANYISYQKGFLSKDLYSSIKNTLKNIYGDLSLPLANDMLPFLKKDKKNISDKLNCVLTKGPGDMFLYEVEYNDVITYIKKFK